MIYLIVLVLFVYLWHRTNVLSDEISELKKSSQVKTVNPTRIPTPAQAMQAAMSETPIPKAPASVAETVVHTTVAAATTTSTISIPTPPATTTTSDTEFNLGSKVFTAVGAIAVLLGVGFFLRYAFENNLISQGSRVLLGCVFGGILISLGHYLRKKYDTYGTTLIGAGFGVFYLSIYAAYSFYQIIDPFSAFIYLTVITALAVALSLWYNSKPLVGFSFAGAFIMPFLLPFSGDIHTLFVYLLIINAGALLIARYKVWPILTVGSLAGTSLIYLKWITGSYTDALFTPTLVYCTLIFLSYFTTSLLNFIYRDRDYQGVDAILLYGTPIVYFLLNTFIMKTEDNVALLALFVGIFNLVMFCVVRFGFAEVGELKKFSEGILLMAALFLAASIGLHFEGSSLTIIWALQAAAMVLIGNLIKSKINTFAGVGLSVITGLKVFLGGVVLPIGSVAVFNGRSATLLFVTLMYAAIWTIFHFDSLKDAATATYKKDEVQVPKYIGILGVFVTVLLWISLESFSFIHDYYLYLPIIWLVYVLIMTSLSFYINEKLPRFLSYFVIFCAFCLMMMDQWVLDPLSHPLIFNVRVLTAIVFALVSGIIVKFMSIYESQINEGERGVKGVLLLLANLSVLWAFTLEVLSYFNQQLAGLSSQAAVSVENTKRVSLSVFWLLYALAGLGVGIFWRSLFARYFSIALFSITIFKIFLYDTANLSDVYRFVSFISLGIILLIVGFVYYKFRDRIAEFVTVAK